MKDRKEEKKGGGLREKDKKPTRPEIYENSKNYGAHEETEL